MKPIILIAIGGAAGSILRYFGQKYFEQNSNFPLGTFMVNIIGCLLIGILYGIFSKSTILNEQLKFLLITGFCGGFTTFSAFSYENFELLKSGFVGTFLLYALSSVAFGLLAVYSGVMIMKWV